MRGAEVRRFLCRGAEVRRRVCVELELAGGNCTRCGGEEVLRGNSFRVRRVSSLPLCPLLLVLPCSPRPLLFGLGSRKSNGKSGSLMKDAFDTNVSVMVLYNCLSDR